MTVKQFKQWLEDNNIPDDFGLFVATFNKIPSCDDIQGIKVNSGGTSVQLEVYPNGWTPISEGSTRIPFPEYYNKKGPWRSVEQEQERERRLQTPA